MKKFLYCLTILSTSILLSCLFKPGDNPKQNSSYSNQIPLKLNTELQNSIERGNLIYDEFCVQCHGTDGKGMDKIFPPLDGADWLTQKRVESIHAIKYGQSGEIVVNGVRYNNVMPPMGLTNKEVADVMNYVMNSWSNTQEKMVTIEEVEVIEP